MSSSRDAYFQFLRQDLSRDHLLHRCDRLFLHAFSFGTNNVVKLFRSQGFRFFRFGLDYQQFTKREEQMQINQSLHIH
jgi:hypothetical protein